MVIETINSYDEYGKHEEIFFNRLAIVEICLEDESPMLLTGKMTVKNNKISPGPIIRLPEAW